MFPTEDMTRKGGMQGQGQLQRQSCWVHPRATYETINSVAGLECTGQASGHGPSSSGHIWIFLSVKKLCPDHVALPAAFSTLPSVQSLLRPTPTPASQPGVPLPCLVRLLSCTPVWKSLVESGAPLLSAPSWESKQSWGWES